MANSLKYCVIGGALSLSAGCVTTFPYEAAFNVCDAQAGDCYRYCEQFADNPDDLAACHADCEADANQCFALAYDDYRAARTGYAYTNYSPWPWYGRYGHWYPDRGFYFGFDYYNGYGYNTPYYGRRPRYRDRNRGNYTPPPPDQSSPPSGQTAPPPTFQKPPSQPRPSDRRPTTKGQPPVSGNIKTQEDRRNTQDR